MLEAALGEIEGKAKHVLHPIGEAVEIAFAGANPKQRFANV